MKLHIIVAPRHDLDFIIEEEYTDIKSNISVYDLVSELAQTPHLTEKSITVIVDGSVVPFADWKKYFLSEEKNHEIKFILEPEGTVVMFAFVIIAMVATFLYTMRMMNKLNSKTGTDKSGESRSIYDVNAQGNKIKLGDVIPEQFGLFKKFPDYLADAHAFYRDNEYYLDLILSQGIGYFQHDLSDIYVGATPISVLQGVQCEVCEPSADLSQNGIAPEITKCWYNSTEVTNSGHTLHPIEKSPDKMIHLEYQSIFVEDWDRLKEFDVGDIVRLTGVSNKWVVTPALQEIKSNRPQILDSRGETRLMRGYKCPFAHEAEFAFTPLYSAAISWQPPQNNGRYNFGIASGFWTDVVAHNYVLGQPTAFKLVCDTSSFSIRGSWSSAVTENDGLYIISDLYRTDLNWNSIALCGTGITKNDAYHGLYATLGGINGDAGQSLLMSSNGYDISYMPIRYSYSGAEDYYHYDNANFTITYGRNNEPWNYRFLPGSMFTVTVIPAVCVKVTKCSYRPELENKFVILPCMLSGEKVSTYTHELPLLGAVGDYYEALFRRSDYVSHIVFDVLDRTSPTPQTPRPIEKIGWPRGTFSDLSPAQQTAEDFYQYTHNAIDFDEDRAGYEFEIDYSTVIYGNLTRITATPEDHWRCYNEQNNIVDDNGYYKVMAVYGGGICRRDSSDTSVNPDSDRIATTFGFNCAGHDRFLDNTSDSYCPNLTKIKVARCDRHGNLITNWDGFFNCVSQSNQIILQNITKGIATNDSTATGPYRAAPIGVDVSEVEVDLYAPGGIYRRNDSGGIERFSVTVRIEYKKAGELQWQHRDVTMSSYGHKRIVSYDPPKYEQTGMDAVGVTEKFDLPKGDWYFRCYRLTEEHTDDTTHYSDVVKWTGLKSVIANPQSYDDITVLLMRFKGSETLSELSDNQISTLFTRMLPNIETDVLEPTSALAPAVKYICDHSKFASLLHIDNIVDTDAIWNVRGLDLNGTLDSDNTLLNVLSDILHIGYSELSTRADGLQIVQIGEHPNVDYEGGSWDNDHLSGPTDYSFIFSPQNYSGLKIDVALPRRDDAEEIEVQYTDVETYKTATVYIHMSSSQYSTIEVTDYPTSIYQEKLQLFGVTEKAQAVAMGARRLRSILRNRIKFTLTTEFDSLNCNYKDFVGLVVDEPTCGMLTAEMRHKPNYGNEYIVVGSNWAGDGYSGRVTNYDNGIIEINPPLTAEQYGGWGNVAHRPTAFFITDEEGQPHLLSIRYNDWINAKSFRATLPVTWYGTDIELPRIVSAVIVPCWVEKIKPTEKNCTVELTMYDSSIFTDDLPMREGYGVSAYGTSPYGKSY